MSAAQNWEFSSFPFDCYFILIYFDCFLYFSISLRNEKLDRNNVALDRNNSLWNARQWAKYTRKMFKVKFNYEKKEKKSRENPCIFIYNF